MAHGETIKDLKAQQKEVFTFSRLANETIFINAFRASAQHQCIHKNRRKIICRYNKNPKRKKGTLERSFKSARSL